MYSPSIVFALLLSPLILAAPIAPYDMTRAAATDTKTCPAAQKLAQGIAANIDDQNSELAATANLVKIMSQTKVDAAKFDAGKTTLVNFVTKGAAIRENNQKIAPAGNAAIKGLAIVADAQASELKLAQGLTGNASKDLPTLATLKTKFEGGIQQNKKNQQDALRGC